MIPEMRVRIGGGRESTVESRKLKLKGKRRTERYGERFLVMRIGMGDVESKPAPSKN
jgi:hypothetical protein